MWNSNISINWEPVKMQIIGYNSRPTESNSGDRAQPSVTLTYSPGDSDGKLNEAIPKQRFSALDAH